MKENSGIDVIILDNMEVKITEIKNVKAIRIKDKKYNLLILKDYWPVIGEINGGIFFEGDETYSFPNIEGFYLLSHNVFKLIVSEMGD